MFHRNECHVCGEVKEEEFGRVCSSVIFLGNISVLLLVLLYASSHLFLFYSNSREDKNLSLLLKLLFINIVCCTCAYDFVTRKFRNIYKILTCEDRDVEELLKMSNLFCCLLFNLFIHWIDLRWDLGPQKMYIKE